jgi:pantothenate kinase
MSDVFRKEYKPLTDLTKMKMHAIKQIASDLHEVFENVTNESDKRCIAIAKTKLEESVMWAIKAITL